MIVVEPGFVVRGVLSDYFPPKDERAAEVQIAAMGLTIFECRQCGASVTNQTQHIIWHRRHDDWSFDPV